MPTSAVQSQPPAASLDLARFADTPLVAEPFAHLVVPGFLRAAALDAITRDFPKIDRGGSFPASSLACGPAIRDLIAELQGPAVTQAFEEKFGLKLTGHPTMVTLRGQSRAKDGRIHRDSDSKLLTALIYLNRDWDAEGGRLRLLHGPGDIESYAAEVPPDKGTLIAFRCSENAYHGHKPHVGPRRSLQLNWVTDGGVVKRELMRHGLSALFKKANPFSPGQA